MVYGRPADRRGDDDLETPLTATTVEIPIKDRDLNVSGLLLHPPEACALLVLGHGAGAGMTHPFMASLAEALATHGIATLRYNFPFKEHDGKRPDREPLLTETVRAAVAAGHIVARRLPVFVGGKSMGGRMASRAMSAEPLAGVEGIIFFGFPLHPAGQKDTRRAAHLAEIEKPMLFLQGTRDRLAQIDLMRNVVAELGDLAQLHVIDDADHSFNMLKRSGRTNADAIAALAMHAAQWIIAHLHPGRTLNKP